LIAALAFRATLDAPDRVAKSRAVAPLRLTPARRQSGETDIEDRISRRSMLALRLTRWPAACRRAVPKLGVERIGLTLHRMGAMTADGHKSKLSSSTREPKSEKPLRLGRFTGLSIN
jgi:transposase